MPDDNPSRPTPTPSSTGPVSTTASASRSGTCRRTRRRPLPSFLSRSLHPQGLGASTTRRAPLLRYHPLPIVGIPFASTDRLSGLPFSRFNTHSFPTSLRSRQTQSLPQRRRHRPSGSPTPRSSSWEQHSTFQRRTRAGFSLRS